MNRIMTAARYFGVEHHIGRTPLIRLRRLSELTGSEILGKAEFMNPGGSVKDRAALGIVADAEAKGLLQPGGTIVEGTAGNTGIGLTIVGHAKGYRTVIVIPETQSTEKINLLRTLGAEVLTVPEKPAPLFGPRLHWRSEKSAIPCFSICLQDSSCSA